MTGFSEYIVYVDESGDHNLDNVYPDFPVFCLAFCVFEKSVLSEKIVPLLQKLKFDFWGHDCIVLHEHEIRKSKNDFTFLLTNKELREEFYARINAIMESMQVHVIASVIRKDKLKTQYAHPNNPYNLALLFCMEKLREFLIRNGQKGKKISVIFEGRGKSEDKDLEIEFRRICDNEGNWGYKNPDFKVCEFEPIFAPKSINSSGLQLADLVARPIAINSIRPQQANRAFEIIKDKLERKVFP